MLQWRVIVLAGLAILLLLGGLGTLVLPDDYESQVIYRLDDMHAISSLDLLGGSLLALGSVLSWSAGLAWQREVYDS